MFRSKTGLLALLVAGLWAVSPVIAQQPSRPQLSSPAVKAPPAWWRLLPMPDGRTFVTDGGLSVDAALAGQAGLPSEILPPETGARLAGLLAGRFEHESKMGDLRPGTASNTFTTPDGVLLNGNYVTFLRQAGPAARMRLRTLGKTDPVVVVVGDRPVAVMMPLQPPR
jgi:hypothetical protein